MAGFHEKLMDWLVDWMVQNSENSEMVNSEHIVVTSFYSLSLSLQEAIDLLSSKTLQKKV